MWGGEARKLTDRKERVESFRWSQDGTRIALLMAEPPPDPQQAREKIAKEAGGTVSFSTAPKEGTTSEVLLPLVGH